MSNIPSHKSYENSIKDFAYWQLDRQDDINNRVDVHLTLQVRISTVLSNFSQQNHKM